MQQKITNILRKIHNGNPVKITTDELIQASDFYYNQYIQAPEVREKSINIGYSAYYGWWSVKKGNRNIDDIKKYIKIHEIDLSTSNPNDNSQTNLEYLKNILAESQNSQSGKPHHN